MRRDSLEECGGLRVKGRSEMRLMSPLLCQLSYTATWRVLYEEDNLTRGRISVSTERGLHLNGPGLVRMLMKAKQASAAVPEFVFDEAAS